MTTDVTITPEIIGTKFNSWTVIGIVDNRIFKCRCDCGGIRNVLKYDLFNGKSRRCNSCANKLRGTWTHGLSKTRLYKCWKDMKGRCFNPRNTAYHDYGGRGITVCEEWANDFLAFRNWALSAGYSDELEIDRINNDGDYEPENCRWVTKIIQNNNTRRNHYVDYQGSRMTLAQLARKHEIDPTIALKRLRRGWSLEDAINPKLGRIPK